MKINYTIDNSPYNFAKLRSDYETAVKMRQFPNNIKVVKYLVKKIYGVSDGEISFMSSQMVAPDSLESKFEIKNDMQKIEVLVGLNKIKLTSDSEHMVFEVLGHLGKEVNLREYAFNNRSAIVVQRFAPHFVELELHFRGNGKVLTMEFPISWDEIFQRNFFDSLTEESSLVDLKRFYFEQFYPYQNSADLQSGTTTLSVWDASQTQYNNPFDKGTKLDELQMGAESHLQLSEKRGHTLVVLRDGVFTIHNYPFMESNSEDYTEVLRDLALRQRKFY